MIRLLNIFLFLISSSFLFLTFYKSELYWGGINRVSYFPYYVIFLSVIIFCLSINFFKKSKQIIILTSIYATILSFLSFETFIFLKNKQQINKKNNKSSLEFVFKERKKENENISIVSVPLFLDDDLIKILLPLSGKSLSETIHCNESNFFSIYESDRYGFNNPDHEWDNDKIEYMLIGDSFVHGACVNRPNDLASVFRILSGKSAINLGWSGNGPLSEYAILKEYFDKKTKNLLWFYYEKNDLDDLALELQNKILKKYLYDNNFTQDLKFKQKEIDHIINQSLKNHYSFNKEIYKFDFFKFIKLTNTRAMLSQNVNIYKFANKKKPQNEFYEILKKVSLFAEKNKTNLYFIYLPAFERYKYDLDFNKKDLIKLIEKLRINIIDIDQEVFQKQTDPKNLFVNSVSNHYNEKGYYQISKKIYELIKNENK